MSHLLDWVLPRLVDKSLMVPLGGNSQVVACPREITALMRTAGCLTSTPVDDE